MVVFVLKANIYHNTINTKCYEPRHDKINKVSVRPAKTQISLGIRPVWSESSLSTWRKLGFLATHWAHSEDWSDCADTQADLILRWAHTHFVRFVMSRLLHWNILYSHSKAYHNLYSNIFKLILFNPITFFFTIIIAFPWSKNIFF